MITEEKMNYQDTLIHIAEQMNAHILTIHEMSQYDTIIDQLRQDNYEVATIDDKFVDILDGMICYFRIDKFLFQVSIGWKPLFRFQRYEDCCEMAESDVVYVTPYTDYKDEDIASIIRDFRLLNCKVGDFEGF